jgi:hypothetical protein
LAPPGGIPHQYYSACHAIMYSFIKYKSTAGEFELATPRDREGNFEPQIVKKHQTTISDEIEEKILSMYALGMSYKDIKSHIEEIETVPKCQDQYILKFNILHNLSNFFAIFISFSV